MMIDSVRWPQQDNTILASVPATGMYSPRGRFPGISTVWRREGVSIQEVATSGFVLPTEESARLAPRSTIMCSPLRAAALIFRGGIPVQRPGAAAGAQPQGPVLTAFPVLMRAHSVVGA